MIKILIFLILFLIYPPTTLADTRVVTANESSSVSSKYPDEEGRMHWHYSSMFVNHLYKNLLFPSQGFYQNRALFKFSNLGLPQGATINNAKLTVYVNETDEALTVPITLGRLLSIWHEDTLTWNTQPSSSVVSVLNIYPSSANMAFDVTNLVKKWLNGTYTNYGLVLYSDLRGNQEYSIVFSSAYTPVEARKPKLDIDYSFTDNTPPVISNVRTSSLRSNSTTISWTSDDASSSKVEYGRTISYGNSVDSPDLVTSHSLALNNLTGATQYHFRVKSKNSSGFEGVSSDRTFTTAIALSSSPTPSPTGISLRAIPVNIIDDDNDQAQVQPSLSPTPSPQPPSSANPTPAPTSGNMFSRIEEGLEDKLQELIKEPENEATDESSTQEATREENHQVAVSKSASPVAKVAGFFAKYRIVWILLLIILALLAVIVFILLRITRHGFYKIKHHIKKKKAEALGEDYSVQYQQIHPPASIVTKVAFVILSIIIAILLIILAYILGVNQQEELSVLPPSATSSTPPILPTSTAAHTPCSNFFNS